MKPFSTRLQHSPRSSSSPGTPDLLSTRSDGDIRSVAASQKLAEALTKLKPSISAYEPGSTAARLAAFASPCFFHSRFDDAVDIDRVLEEIAADESMSHSRLVQSATAVREVSRQLQRRPIKRAVKNVMIVTKARDNSLVLLTRELAQWLMRTPRYGSSAGVNVYVDEKLKKSKRFDAANLVSEDARFERMLRYWHPEYCRSSSQKFDLVITLGGDGTVLFTSWLFQQVVPPILSFSLGSLGFLTPFEFSNYRKDLNRVMGGICPTATPSLYSSPTNPSPLSFSTSTSEPQPPADPGMRVNLRMRFTCTVHRAASHIPTPATSTSRLSSRASSHAKLSSLPPVSEAHEPMQFEVLNELVIDRGPSPYVSNLELFGDDSLLTVIQADGVIFSTPTGSTAYSLSAGGSLVHPDIPAILLTPICPHTLSFRPMLLNDTMMLKIAVPRTSRATAYCSFDGKNRTELRRGDYVTISASRYPFPTVVGERTEWIDSVSRTLRWNTREAQQKDWGSGRPQHIRANSRIGGSMHHVGGDTNRNMSSSSAQVSDAVSHLTLDEPLDGDVLEDEEEEEEEFDIDIDGDEDKREIDGVDSGYGGDGSTSSAGAGASPARQNSS